MHLEVLTELWLRESTGARAFALEAVAHHRADRLEQARACVVVEGRERRVRRELRAPQRVVGVAPADARHRSLVAQQRVDAAAVVAVEDQLRELRRLEIEVEAEHPGALRLERGEAPQPGRVDVVDQHARDLPGARRG